MEILKGNYLVTGASGSMGTTALKRMANIPNVFIRAVDIVEPRISASNISFIKADLKDFNVCKKITEGIDYVFMFAAILSTAPVMAENPVSHVTSNMIINSQILEAAYFAGIKKFLWLSSTTGYPKKDGKLKEEDIFKGDPPDNYFSVGWMSRYTEALCRMYATKLKRSMPAVVLRPTNIYSEYETFDPMKSHVLPALIKKVVDRQKPIQVLGDGEQRKDLVYSDDVFDACLLALEKVSTFDSFNIGSGKEYSIKELLELAIELDRYKEAEIKYNVSKHMSFNQRSFDLSKSKKILDFKAKTEIKKGVGEMIKEYKKLINRK